MKIIAEIPVKKVWGEGGFYFTYETKQLEVEVVAVVRIHASKNKALKRFHYEAFVKPHPEQAKETFYNAPLYRCNVNRHLNKKWKPPIFKEGETLAIIYD